MSAYPIEGDAFESALVVDRSVVARDLLSAYLRTYFKDAVALETIADARRYLNETAASLVVLDATLDGGLAWFEETDSWTVRPASSSSRADRLATRRRASRCRGRSVTWRSRSRFDAWLTR